LQVSNVPSVENELGNIGGQPGPGDHGQAKSKSVMNAWEDGLFVLKMK
jgi:hypothetical protein